MKKSHLKVQASAIENGISISLDILPCKKFTIEYPDDIWQKTPPSIQRVLADNLAFANTHFLPLMLKKKSIAYNFPAPLLESFLFKNQLYDMIYCEQADNVPHLSYFKQFYNLEHTFNASKESALPDNKEIGNFQNKQDSAIIPFTFGKESLLTVALCIELGIKPILVYSQEPSHPYEEVYKLKKLEEFKKEFNIDAYFIKNGSGLFRYGKAFQIKSSTEIGWGSQTTILALMMLPFVYQYQAKYILSGDEKLNNEFENYQGWNSFSSNDQTSVWTLQKNNMIRLLTKGQCFVKSSLEPLEEIAIFWSLHNKYPEFGKYQFSCSAEYPLYENTAWCHKCYKCARMYLFAEACGISPETIGFKKNLLQRKVFGHYFGKEKKTGSTQELDFAFYILYKKKKLNELFHIFEKEKLPMLKPWTWYKNNFLNLQEAMNLPNIYKPKMLKIFEHELHNLYQNITANT